MTNEHINAPVKGASDNTTEYINRIKGNCEMNWFVKQNPILPEFHGVNAVEMLREGYWLLKFIFIL